MPSKVYDDIREYVDLQEQSDDFGGIDRMRRKLSVKLGLLFFVLMLLIELSLFFILYSTIASHRVTEVMDGLLAKGAGHRDVLENNYDDSTLHHVILMEEEASTDVIITNADGEIVDRSSNEAIRSRWTL